MHIADPKARADQIEFEMWSIRDTHERMCTSCSSSCTIHCEAFRAILSANSVIEALKADYRKGFSISPEAMEDSREIRFIDDLNDSNYFRPYIIPEGYEVFHYQGVYVIADEESSFTVITSGCQDGYTRWQVSLTMCDSNIHTLAGKSNWREKGELSKHVEEAINKLTVASNWIVPLND